VEREAGGEKTRVKPVWGFEVNKYLVREKQDGDSKKTNKLEGRPKKGVGLNICTYH